MANPKNLSPRSIFQYPLTRFPFFEIEEEGQQSWPLSWLQEQSEIEISTDNDHVYVKVPLPGLNTDEIEIHLENGVLWIKGEKKEKAEEKNKERKFYRQSSRTYSYKISLPEQIDESKEPTAIVNNGILEITFPKAMKNQSKKITVKSK